MVDKSSHGYFYNSLHCSRVGAGSEQTGPLYRGNPAPAPSRGSRALRASLLGTDKTRAAVTSGVTGDSGHQGDLHTVCPVGCCNLHISTEMNTQYQEKVSSVHQHFHILRIYEGSMCNRGLMKLSPLESQ